MAGANERPHEPRFRFESSDFDELLSEWRSLGRDCLESVEEFTRERPAESLAIALLAGAILGAYLGRR
jgi:hypothetical protein